jgi:hypothetical protein
LPQVEIWRARIDSSSPKYGADAIDSPRIWHVPFNSTSTDGLMGQGAL